MLLVSVVSPCRMASVVFVVVFVLQLYAVWWRTLPLLQLLGTRSGRYLQRPCPFSLHADVGHVCNACGGAGVVDPRMCITSVRTPRSPLHLATTAHLKLLQP